MKTNARKYIGLLLALCMVMSLLPATALAADGNCTGNHSGWKALSGSISSLSGNCYLTGNVTVSSDITISSDVTLCLNGKELNLCGVSGIRKNYNCIKVAAGASLTICDCGMGGTITVSGIQNPNKPNGAIEVNGGTLTLESGSISGNTTRGVYVSGGGTFTMSGGTISDNESSGVYVTGINSKFTMTGGTVSGNKSSGVYVTGGTFEMTGGTISGNSGSSSNNANVYLFGGSFTMSDGTISGSTGNGVYVRDNASVTMSGGTISGNDDRGVSVVSGSFTMSGGAISDNTESGGVSVSGGTFTMSGGAISGNTSKTDSGGGVKLSGGSFTMSGNAQITGNTAGSSTAAHSGGGVSVSDGSFTMSDNAQITGNRAYDSGGGVEISNAGGTTASVTLSGEVRITGNKAGADDAATDSNLYLPYGKTITIGEVGLEGEASIGVSANDTLGSGQTRAITTATDMGNMAYFTSDAPETSSIVYQDGAIHLSGDPTHRHGWNFNYAPITAIGGTLSEGRYYLKENVDVTQDIAINGGAVYLCLNGNTLNLDGHTITVNSGSLILYDCADNYGGTGKITGGPAGSSAIVVNSSGNLTLGSGTITGNPGGGIRVNSGGNLAVYGSSADDGNGTVNVTDNGSSNVSLAEDCTIDTPYAISGRSFQIGVSMDAPGVFTSGGGATYKEKFTSDDSEYEVQISGNELCLSSGFTVGFDLGGAAGTPPTNQEVENGGKATEPTAPTWEGHTFAGWYNSNTLWNFDTVVTGNMTLTAKWITNPTVTVTGGTSLTYGTGGTLTANVTEAEDHTYTYQWYSNTTNSNTGGTIIEGAVSSIYTIPNTTNRGTYYYYCTVTASIDGSSKTASATSDDVTVTVSAKGYDSSSFTISDIDDQTYTGSQISPPVTVTCGGKTLDYGTDYTLDYGENVNVGTDVGTVTINFTGNYSGSTTVYFNIVKASQTAPGENEGYTIDYEDETITVESGYEVCTAQSDGTQVASGSITDYLGQTLYIRKTETGTHNASDWTEFTIASRPVAPSVTAVDETIKDKRDGKVTGVDTTMEYKVGDGAWQDCTGTEITCLAAGTTVTVRVKATANAPHGTESACTIEPGDTLAVTFDENGGSAVKDITGLSYDATITAPTTTRAGYTFAGWYNGDAKWDFATGVTADLTLTAKWTLDAPTVSLTADKNNVTYGTEITLTATATHTASGNITYAYEWYKGESETPVLTGEGDTYKSLTIENVNDSGSYTVKVTASDGTLTSAVEKSIQVSIGKATPTLSVSAAEITYGQSLSNSQLAGTATHNNQDVSGTFAWQTGSINPEVSDSGVTGYTVVFTPTDTANYNSAEAQVTVSVAKKTLTPSVGSVASKTYDGSAATEGTITLTGAVLNENPTASGVFTFEKADAGTDKTVKVTVTLGDGWASNYVLAETALTTKANITPKTVGLTWSGYENLVYDGEPVGVTAAATGLVSGDQCAVTVENGDKTDAGTYTAKATGLDNPNYQLPDTGTTQSYTIAPRPVKLSWSESSFTYDGSEKTVTATIENLVSGDIYALTYSGNAETEHGSYTAEVTALDNNNYTLTNGAGLTHSWSIGKAVVSFTVTGNSHTYDGDAKTAAVTQDDGQTQIPAGGFTVTYGNAASQTEAGTYDITVTITNSNFCFEGDKDTMVVGKLSIGKQAVTIPAADDTEFVYNGAEQTYAIAESELYTVEGNAQKDAGTYTVTVSLNDKDNYVWPDDTTDDRTYTFMINPKPVTATWVGLEQVYGSTEPVSVILSGLAEGDEDFEAVISGVSTEAGEHPLNASLKNYDIINGTATLRIQQKPVTITVTDNAVTVGGEPAISAPGLAESDYEVVYKDKNGNEVTPSEPGTYEVWVEITNPNYRHPDGSSEKQVGSVVVSSGTPRTYEVSFAGSGAGGSTAGMKAAGGSVITLPECGFTKPGSVFTGWKYFNVVYKPGDSFTMPSSDVTFTAQWAQSQSVGGKVQDKGGAPVEGAAVSIWQGSNKLDEDVTGSNGAYSFPDLAPGSYNVSVSTGEKTVTTVVMVDENGQVTGGNIVLPEGNISTRVDVTPGSPDIVVGDLDRAFTDADKETAASGGTVEIAVKVEQKPESGLTPGEAEQLEDKADGELGLFVDISLDKTTTPSGGSAYVENGVSSEGVLTIIIPLPTELKDKDIYTVVRTDGATGEALSSEPDELSGEYYELTEDGSGLILHVKESGVYAVGGRDYQIVIPTYPPVKTESENGSFAVSPDRPFSGQTVTITPKPDEGYTVDKVTVTDASGKAVEVSPNGDGTYSFTQPSGAVTITVTFKVLTDVSECPRDASCPMSGYTDLNMGEWYHDGIHYCLDEGLMDGVDAGMFAPNATTSRAMIVTILWRLQGSPEVEATETFTDVSPDAWYAKAIAWAVAEGVADGYGEGLFGPNDAITREQLAAMLWRYAASPETGGDLSAFADGADTSVWAQQAMSWAVSLGLINGVDSDRLAPKGQATRAQTATILMRFAQSETK